VVDVGWRIDEGAMAKVGRNDSCPCGSGKKYKRCCEAKRSTGGRLMLVALGVGVVAAVLLGVAAIRDDGDSGPRRVWSAEHGHYHEVP
jgi:hypothetical protein